jgi:hypothetical protein
MIPARLSLAVLMAGLALTLTGCIWLRLLALKNQFAEFDRYVKVDDRHDLELQFVKPVLYARDVRALFELEPTSKCTNLDQQTWYWTFEKIPAPTQAEPGDFSLTFSTTFVDNKLTRFAIPERFLVVLPKPFVLGMFRSLGQARVDQAKRTLGVKWAPDGEARVLTQPEVSRLLGQPFSLTEAKTNETWLYRYQLKSPSLNTNQHLLARVGFTFVKETGTLGRVDASYGNFRINMSFDAPPPPPPRL